MLYNLVIGANILLSLLVAVRYVEAAWNRRASPALATWVVMLLVMGILIFMYSQNPKKSWTGNIGMLVGTMGSLMIFLGVLIVNIRDRTLHLAFSHGQRLCLLGCGIVIAFWAIAKQPLTSYILVQLLALMAYMATFHRLLTTKQVSEPLNAWLISLVSNMLAVYPAWMHKDIHAWIYLGRTTPTALFVITVILWKNRKNRVS